MRKITKITKAARFAVLTLLSVLLLSFAAAAEPAVCWFITRTDDHSQPPSAPELTFAETCGAYRLDTAATDDDRVLYLTFDAGYENGNIAKILDILKAHDAQGSFFILSHLLEANPDLVCRMAAEGHLVCNHTAHHKDMTAVDEQTFQTELTDLASSYAALTGKEMARYFRPPEGKFNRTVLSRAAACGYKTVFWSLAYADWDNAKQPDAEKAFSYLYAHTHNGMILLLHPTSATNAQILDRLLTAWEGDGYRFATLDELGKSGQNGETDT